MRILITGACGRIGSQVVRRLVELGTDVVGIDSTVHGGNLGELTRRLPLLVVDIQDLASILRVMQTHAITRVIHLAAALGDQYDAQPWGSYQVNLGGTINVLEAARFAGVERVVAASTHNIYPRAYGAYGPPTWRPIAEDHAPEPRRPYAVMKLACEHMGRIYADEFGVDFAAVRFASYYGAERAIRRGSKFPDLLNRMILDAVEGVPTMIDRGGDQVFDPVYIKDCAHGVICAVLAKSPRCGRVYNIGGGSPLRLADAAQVVRGVFPGAQIHVGPGFPDGLAHHPPLDISRARAEIEYDPQFSLSDGVRDCGEELRRALARSPQRA
jgi:UDP-glucose 4-epimerase